MKRSSGEEMRARRRAAYRKAWHDAMDVVLGRIDTMARDGELPAAVAQELRAVCRRAPPELGAGGQFAAAKQAEARGL